MGAHQGSANALGKEMAGSSHQKTTFEAYQEDLRIQKQRKVQSRAGNEAANLWVSEVRRQRLEGR